MGTTTNFAEFVSEGLADDEDRNKLSKYLRGGRS